MLPLRLRFAVLAVVATLFAGCYVAERPEAPSSSSRSSASSIRSSDGVRWSETDPPINLSHVFAGLINKRGKSVGFHARPGGVDPEGARLVRVIEGPNRAGVYVATVAIRSSSGRWEEKTSSLYPDDLSESDVVAAILAAFAHAGGGEKWRGDSGRGFTIEGYFQNGRINTAYPIYRGSRGR